MISGSAFSGRLFTLPLTVLIAAVLAAAVQGEEPTPSRERIARSMALGQTFLLSRQLEDGAFPADGALTHPLEATCLAGLAFLHSGMSVRDVPVRKTLEVLRRTEPESIRRTHELALAIMFLATVGEADDRPRIGALAERLAGTQSETGEWPFVVGELEGDLSVTHFAFVGLQDAALCGVPIRREVWERGREDVRRLQQDDGGWTDFASASVPRDPAAPPAVSTPSATFAGLASLKICGQALRADGTGASDREDPWSDRAALWLRRRAMQPPSRENPEPELASHVYALERGHRLQGDLFGQEHRWSCTGMAGVLGRQDRRYGRWRSNNDVMSTAYAMLALSNELAPAVVGKVHLERPGSDDGSAFAATPHDVWHLLEHVRGRHQWPRLVRARDVVLDGPGGAVEGHPLTGDERLLFLTGGTLPALTDGEVRQLREYVARGGTILAAPAGDPGEFETGLLPLIDRVWEGRATLAPLGTQHPVALEPYELAPGEEAWMGVQSGCRTSLFYVPFNLSKGWEEASPFAPGCAANDLSRPESLAVRLGTNVVTYAVGSRFPERQLAREAPASGATSTARGHLRVAQLRHSGNWSVAPHALERIVQGINTSLGISAAARPAAIACDDEELLDHMVLFLHGHGEFAFSRQERERLRFHLENGGFLLADACCGNRDFDRSFRRLVSELFPEEKLAPLPDSHEVFDGAPVPRPVRAAGPDSEPSGDESPVLEGLVRQGRLMIVYSRHDLSCALEGTAGQECAGFRPEDALRLTTRAIATALVPR